MVGREFHSSLCSNLSNSTLVSVWLPDSLLRAPKYFFIVYLNCFASYLPCKVLDGQLWSRSRDLYQQNDHNYIHCLPALLDIVLHN